MHAALIRHADRAAYSNEALGACDDWENSVYYLLYYIAIYEHSVYYSIYLLYYIAHYSRCSVYLLYYISGTLTEQNVALTLWALATMGRTPEKRVLEVLEQRVQDISGVSICTFVLGKQVKVSVFVLWY